MAVARRSSTALRTAATSPVVRYLIAAALLTTLLLVVDLDATSTAIRSADPLLLATGYLAGVVPLLLTTFKWRELLRARSIDARFSRLLELNLATLLYGTILPGQVAGEAVKVMRIISSERDRGTYVASVFLDRVTGLAGLLVVGTAGALASSVAPAGVVAVMAIALLAVIGVTVGAFAAGHGIEALARRLPRVGAPLGSLVQATTHYRRHRAVLLWATALGALFQLLTTISMMFLARAVGVDASLATLCWIVAIIFVVQLVPITIGGIGTREASMVALLVSTGTDQGSATALSVLVLASVLGWAAIGGVSEAWSARHAARTPRSHIRKA